jgi:hypothetical protein
VLRGIQDAVGSGVPIAGGSAADNTIEGHWHQFANDQVFTDGVVVSVMSPSVATHCAFRSGYYPTQYAGRVTEADGRTLMSIDGRPAAQVYNEWTGGTLDGSMQGGTVLGDTTLHPLGRLVIQVGEVGTYRLSHPEAVTAQGGLRLFTDIQVGDDVVLMMGSRQSLIARAGVVAKAAMRRGSITSPQVAGALVIFCAGCMLAVQDDMDDVVDSIVSTLGDSPFLGAFTFGEQGCFVGGENHHGNLMISMVIFERD